jgi:hypothetical protein
MSRQAKHSGLLVVACYGPALEIGAEEENLFHHVMTFGTVSDKLRRSLSV